MYVPRSGSSRARAASRKRSALSGMASAAPAGALHGAGEGALELPRREREVEGAGPGSPPLAQALPSRPVLEQREHGASHSVRVAGLDEDAAHAVHAEIGHRPDARRHHGAASRQRLEPREPLASLPAPEAEDRGLGTAPA